MLAGIEAALANFDSIRAADDIRNGFPALATLLGRPHQSASFEDELIEGGNGIF